MLLHELLDMDLLAAMVSEGYVRFQTHPTRNLVIYNYTEKAQYERVWNDATRQCRGLIVEHGAAGTGRVVARPFAKFFNYGEPTAISADTGGPVLVTDKLDGSLGVMYQPGTVPYIATRGSFTSEQAQHANEVLTARYPHFRPTPGLTYLFEIIYPANRVVVDYGTRDDLVLLAVVDTETGRTLLPHGGYGWPGPVAEQLPHASLTDAVAAEPRDGAEGMVVHFASTDERLKIKQADYVYLHRIITGFTARRLWERCAVRAVVDAHPNMPMKRVAQGLRMSIEEAQTLADLGPDWVVKIAEVAPEEFLGWIDDTISRFTEQATEIWDIVHGEALGIRNMPRKDAALSIADHPYRGLIFAALDGKPLTAQVWREVYPEHEKPFWTRTEDAA